jgi:hypothetical protein
MSHTREPATPLPAPSPQDLSIAEAALAAKEIQRKQTVLKENKQHAVDAKRAAEDLASSSSSDEAENPNTGDGEAALAHLKTVDAMRDTQLKAEQLKLQTSAAELETAKLTLQAARAAKAASEAIIEEALEDDKTVLPPEATAKLISRTRSMQVTGFPATTEILDVPKYRHALKSVAGSEGGLATLAAPVHNGIWQRLGKGNYNPGRLSPKEATGSEKLHTLQAYLPASKNRKKGQGTPPPPTLTGLSACKPALTSHAGARAGSLQMDAGQITVHQPPTVEGLILTTRMQLIAAIFTRMNYMLRCPIETSLAFLQDRERGNFCEYCQWLFHLSYTLTVGGVVELDMMLLRSRKDGEWKDFGLPPDRITKMNWPKLIVPICAFCEVRLSPSPPSARAKLTKFPPPPARAGHRARIRPLLAARGAYGYPAPHPPRGGKRGSRKSQPATLPRLQQSQRLL